MHDRSVTVGLGDDEGSAISDERRLRTGLRVVRMRAWTTSINGERLFLKGANQGPARMQLAEATAEDLARDVDLAPAANPDLLRLHGHTSLHEPYDTADSGGRRHWTDMTHPGGTAADTPQKR